MRPTASQQGHGGERGGSTDSVEASSRIPPLTLQEICVRKVKIQFLHQFLLME